VTNPMLPVARVASIKSEDGRFDIRSLERALRDVCGFSQSEAKALLADGFKGLQAERDVAASGKDADADASAFIAKLMQSTEICNVRT